MTFTVYTYFGRVLKVFHVPENRTHHETMEAARKFLVEYQNTTGNPAWIR